MKIKKAQHQHLNSIMDIIAEARQIMRESGNNTQWTNGYPSIETIADDIEKGQAFICESGNETVGYFCLMTGEQPEPTYAVIENGHWLDDAPYGVIHRLASGRKVKGIAQKAFEYAFSVIHNIKVDTHHDNIPMQRFLEKAGFAYCGIIYVSDGTPRDAFQKRLP